MTTANAYVRVEICGGIATGKTTLAKLLAQRSGSSLVLEDFQSNPFWKRFNAQPARYVREKNLCFIAQHTGEIKAFASPCSFICDYAVVQDLAYASLLDDPEHSDLMERAYSHLYTHQPAPRLLILLVCDETVQLNRIRERGRVEEETISVEYLQSLNEALRLRLVQHPPPCPVLTVRGDTVDFANDPVQSQALVKKLLDSINLQC